MLVLKANILMLSTHASCVGQATGLFKSDYWDSCIDGDTQMM